MRLTKLFFCVEVLLLKEQEIKLHNVMFKWKLPNVRREKARIVLMMLAERTALHLRL